MRNSRKKYNEDKFEKFLEYMWETSLNKICAIALVALGSLPVILDRDGTCLVIMLLIAIPMFVSRKNWIY